MATLTIRNLPERTVDRLKKRAQAHHRSMEQEVRELLEMKLRERSDALERIEVRWERLTAPAKADVDQWLAESRTRTGSTRLESPPAGKKSGRTRKKRS